ncbi:phytoene dehydrogenase [Kitasatospora herbaricolor]|uniref:phytoene desaturase family protein n=1 Tax=Kitasatospora herbaricolor TaxID=68217 RepID=UPI00174BD0F4|nr:NAD(P)/FAD-dependent oxidoreductase [Kitasatospora herbaricolor]MDQ0307832.1 phytoene desaturase [Kitasatospora herbaricolor]GGV25845.1 phytoene dehydrogenase [Kitasatospora herbaricolor]
MARIVIIGAGMSGLAAASRLATLGHRVTVCEASGTYGGMVGRYERDGFAFDTGPGLLTLPAVYRDLALKTGREPLEELVGLAPVDPESRHLLPDGTTLLLPNASRGGVARALDAAFGAGSGERWSEVMNHGRTVWEATRRPLLEEPLPADPERLRTDPYPAPPRRGLGRLRRTPWTLAEVAGRELDGRPGLTALLHEYALRFGFDPSTAPAGATVLAYMEQSFGVWYVRGGIRALADAVYRRCLDRKVGFRFDCPVEQVLSDPADGRVTGVRLAGGDRLEADTVISSTDARTFHPDAVGRPGQDGPRPGDGQRADRQRDEAAARVPGRFTVLLALRGSRPAAAAHRTVVHAADGAAEREALFGRTPELYAHPTVQVLRPDDPTLHPEGHESVSLTVTVPSAGALDWSRPEAAERYADQVLDRVDAAGLGLRGRLLWRVLRTPLDTAAETGALFGSVPRPALAGAGGSLLQAPNQRPGPGLFVIGGAAHPGGGLARVGMSACITAGLIGPA